MSSTQLAGIILAAGKGTRMKSDLPKCLHPVCTLPMAEWGVRVLHEIGINLPVVVIGHGGELLKSSLEGFTRRDGRNIEFAWQRDQLGTGHAALQVAPFLKDFKGSVFVISGDTPLIRPESLRRLAEVRTARQAVATMATVVLSDPFGYGRVVRSADGDIEQIVEEKDANEHQKLITEVNVSVYCFDSRALFEILPNLGNSNAQGEYYLTDAIAAMIANGGRVEAVSFPDSEEFSGVNDRWQLALVERAMRLRLLRRHAEAGVTLSNVDTTFIGPDVTVGPDCVLESGTVLRGNTTIGARARIGPDTSIDDGAIGEDCKIFYSLLRECVVGARTNIGPFAHLRPHSQIGADSKIGNFVEVKNSTISDKVAVSHLSYVGDSSVDFGSNIGAGTITCNYDGFTKHRTEIGKGVFVGSNSTLVAPISIGDGAIVAAGSVVTVDVPAGAGSFGRARTEIKEGWAAKWRSVKQESKP